MKPPKILNAILCEDIRMEFTGKFVLVGVTGSDLMIINPQEAIVCGIFADTLPSELGEERFEFRVVNATGKELIRALTHINVAKCERQPIVFGPFNFVPIEYGEIKFQWRQTDGRWITIKEFNILPFEDVNLLPLPENIRAEITRRLEEDRKSKA